jgi:membrane protease YdiL (CAAX protease family)
MRLAVLAIVAVAGCFRPTPRARTTAIEPPSPAEIEAADRIASRSCSELWSFAFPGLGQLCTGERGVGAGMVALGAAEIGAAVYAATAVEVAPGEKVLEHPAVGLPLVGFQDLYVYSVADMLILRDRATRQLYAPPDSTVDLLAAPFNLEVMKRPEVWGGLAAILAVGIGVSLALEGEVDTSNVGEDPNILGQRFRPEAGYPLGFGILGGLFTHVGIAEEALFRGYLQSALARKYGETGGLIAGSLIFGIVHAPNALAFEGDDRRNYLLYAVPTITALGTYLSWVYKEAGYNLAPSTAMHFWYDFLLSATFFVLDPTDSPLSASVSIPF